VRDGREARTHLSERAGVNTKQRSSKVRLPPCKAKYVCEKPMRSENAGAEQVEITPEMIEVGVNALVSLHGFVSSAFSAEHLVSEVYKAMAATARDQRELG